MISIFTGVVAGWVHVYSGPDHLAAVAPLAMQGRERAWRTGVRWGVGHAGGVIVVGLLALLFRELLPLEAISSWSERLVGVVLIGIGLWGLRKAFTQHVHIHEHTHNGRTHRHLHVHGRGHSHAAREPAPHAHTHTAFAVGTLHGLAGSSHVLGVLPALAFPTRWQAAGYLAAYGAGTILAMASFSSVLALLTTRFATGATAYRAVMSTCSAVAVAVGCWWMVA